ncbi:acyl-CoA desaturase [Wenzhouxiangella limi]|uniref:Acyl-CoA desaturase n=1 Tax=Wenzhouxiangella limi TaxID=2707351 RepID=A0A845V510_9GAMM|nr:fatty acid desaturase [Wenzhouxiangella limi]NDY95045.1 acyl-CoA desaturase [Wenzhouxiangella limi]
MSNTKPPLVVSNVIFFVAVNLLGFVAAPIYGLTVGFSGWAWLAAAVIWIASGLSITVGYHRLWSHRTFRAAWPLRLALAVFGTFSLQNSILIWAARHRVHHRHVDDVERDPHSILSGFWHAHMGWMTRRWKTSEVNLDEVPDLQKDPIVMWQHKLYWPAVWILNIGVPAALGWLTGDVLGMILLAGAFRLAVSQHFTFFINSLAHTWGRRNYSLDNTARDNGWIALMTWGEGYHNFHHAFQADYRNGLRWWQFDPSKWLIAASAWLGLAADLKRTPWFKVQRARLQIRFRELEERLANADAAPTWREVFDRELHQFRDTVSQWQAVQAERVQVGADAVRDRWRRTEFRTRYKELEYRLKMQARRLAELQRSLQPAPA